MKNNQKIKSMREDLRQLEHDNQMEKTRLSNEFREKMETLIANTPTGELRNQLTDLNILHHAIMETL